jgi:hypothetical protein
MPARSAKTLVRPDDERTCRITIVAWPPRDTGFHSKHG